MKKNTKAAKIMKMLEAGESVSYIKRMLAVSESYIYTIKKLLANNVEAVKETILSIDDNISFTMPEPEADTNVDAILNERARNYGSFATQAKIAQRLKHVAHTTANELGKTYDADQAEALDMIFSKIARIVNGNSDHIDSLIDSAGYAKLVADRLEGKVR